MAHHIRTLFLLLVFALFAGCNGDSDLEDAGEDLTEGVEDAAEEVEDAAEDAADDVEDAAEDATDDG